MCVINVGFSRCCIVSKNTAFSPDGTINVKPTHLSSRNHPKRSNSDLKTLSIAAVVM
jgi:hypothetical protein